MERIKVGIAGMDEMLKGGIPKHRHIAICGGPGSGKTSLCFEYLYRGAKLGEKGLYVSLEETSEDILENLQNAFSGIPDLKEMVDSKQLEIAKPDKLLLEDVAELIEDRITSNNVTRIVIDSSTMIRLSFKDLSEYRQTMFEFFSLLRNLDCTALMVVESPSQKLENTVFEIEHYVMDGIINLYTIDKGEQRLKAMEVYKMRGTDHIRALTPYKITPMGIKVYVGEKVF
ncbi:AAA family ATPase [Candidatus Micrarchaeota archaeon]|nr:AAA family ATPase [Candidatus Micrarchaeota archaeon]